MMNNQDKSSHVCIPPGFKRTTGGGVFTREEFRALAKYERARSDRNGSAFAIILFDSRLATSDAKMTIVDTISRFSRSIDCVGLADDGKIAVLLPDTIKQGAETFGRKVKDELEKVGKDGISYDAYYYPEDWLSPDKGIAYPRDDLGHSSNDRDLGYTPIQGNIEFLFVDRIPLWKRVLDMGGASILMILTSPVLLLLFAYIKLISPGPVIFTQTRIGYKGVPFDFYKFRTMKVDNNQQFHGTHAQSFIKSGDVPMEKLDNRDPRIIFGGRVIRKSCLDELPQLWNVLKGNMSLVGPRPCIPYEAKEYLRWHTHRFDMLPGMSGLWQISGKNKLTFKQMVRLDIAYCNNVSLLGDIGIILRTPFAILKMVAEATADKITQKTGESFRVSMLDIPKKAHVSRLH